MFFCDEWPSQGAQKRASGNFGAEFRAQNGFAMGALSKEIYWGTESDRILGTESGLILGTESELISGTESELILGTESEPILGTEIDTAMLPCCFPWGSLSHTLRSSFVPKNIPGWARRPASPFRLCARAKVEAVPRGNTCNTCRATVATKLPTSSSRLTGEVSTSHVVKD